MALITSIAVGNGRAAEGGRFEGSNAQKVVKYGRWDRRGVFRRKGEEFGVDVVAMLAFLGFKTRLGLSFEGNKEFGNRFGATPDGSLGSPGAFRYSSSQVLK